MNEVALAELTVDEQKLLEVYRSLTPADRHWSLQLFMRLTTGGSVAPVNNSYTGCIFNYSKIDTANPVINRGLKDEQCASSN